MSGAKDKWHWKMNYCYEHRLSAAQSWAWDEAEHAYNQQYAPQNTKVQNGHIAQHAASENAGG
jgi:hypothetical protein